jgi:hypothetical protein
VTEIALRARFITASLVAVLGVFGLALVALLFAGGSVVADVVLLALLGGLVTVQLRLWRSGLVLTAEGVQVRTVRGDTCVAWGLVEGLEKRTNFLGGVIVGVRLLDGDVLCTQGLVARDQDRAAALETRFEGARATLLAGSA